MILLAVVKTEMLGLDYCVSGLPKHQKCSSILAIIVVVVEIIEFLMLGNHLAPPKKTILCEHASYSIRIPTYGNKSCFGGRVAVKEGGFSFVFDFSYGTETYERTC